MIKKLALPFAALALGAGLAAHAATPTELLGDVVPADQATHTIQITPQTRYVNVTEDDTVAFASNGQQFAVHFDGVRTPGFELNQLAPPGALDHVVKVYVAPSRDSR